MRRFSFPLAPAAPSGGTGSPSLNLNDPNFYRLLVATFYAPLSPRVFV
jgi:hypothetical protein